MSRRSLLLLFIVFCVLDLAFAFAALQPRSVSEPDLAAVNETVQRIRQHGPDAQVPGPMQYAVLAEDGTVLFRSAKDVSADFHTAALHRDLILPVRAPSGQMLLVLFENETGCSVPAPAAEQVFVLLCAGAQIAALAWILTLVDRRILTPYQRLESTAARIARGQFDVPLRYDKGTAFGAFTESIDLLRTELARAQAAEKKASAEKRELISNLSHELRTPLSSMIAAAELGELKASSSEDAAAFRRIADKGKQLSVLAANLLSASLADEQKLTVCVREVPAETVHALLEDAGIQNVPAIPGPGILADPVRLTQVVDNIVSNTLKHGRMPLSVTASARDGMLLLAFEDTGGGADEEELAALRLRGVRGRRAKDTEGAGLGLYICDQLISAMHGQLLLQNGPHGLRVTVALPLQAA